MADNNSQLNMHYDACPKKIKSRDDTIISTYRKHYKRESIPKNSQYWTICGLCSYENNVLAVNSEPDQIVRAGLATLNQIHGVEIIPEIHYYNEKSNCGVNWHLGDFLRKMIEYDNDYGFVPAIVNADLITMPKNSISYVGNLIQFLSLMDNEIMLTVNMVCRYRHMRGDMEDFFRMIEKNPNFCCGFDMATWNFHDEHYWYNGTGTTGTEMMTLILFKEKKYEKN